MSAGTEIEPLVDVEKTVDRSYDLREIEVREADDGRIEFRGEAAVFGQQSLDLGGFNEVIERGAFRKVLATDPDVRFLINHDPSTVCARTRSGTMQLKEGPTGLEVRADLAPVSYAKDLQVLVKRGDVDQMSFGFRVGKGNDRWQETRDGGILRSIRGFETLKDVSAVTFGAYPQTTATVRSLDIELRAKYSSNELASMAKNGQAMKNDSGDASYPIADTADLKKAIQAVGRGGADHDAIRRHIIKRAKALNSSDLIPDNWAADGSVKDQQRMLRLTAALRDGTLTEDELRQLLTQPADKTSEEREADAPRYRLAARQRRLQLIEKRDAVTSSNAPAGAVDLPQANMALQGIQNVIEDMEDTLEQAGYPDPDDPPDDDSADELEPITADDALKTLQAGIERIEDILDRAGFPDPDDD